MKVLHTADWHVGKTLQGKSRAEEAETVLAEIEKVARSAAVDLILVAGDQFDSGAPSPEAERIVYRALLGLADVAPVVVIPGNHDSDRRLAAVAPVFASSGVWVKPHIDPSFKPLEIPTRSGEIARIALLPWLSQRYLVKADQLMSKDAADISGDYHLRMKRIISAITAPFTPDAVNIVLGHVTIAGGELGGGERTAQTIFDYWIDAGAFPASAHYVALGHLHKAQRMPGPCPIHYCGSPMQLDFSETDDSKRVVLVEATPRAPAIVEEVPLSAGRKLRTIRGTVDGLRVLSGGTGYDYLRVFVTEPARVGLGDEIRDLFPNALKVIVEPPDRDPAEPTLERAGASPRDLFGEYLIQRNVKDSRLVDLFQELYEECSA